MGSGGIYILHTPSDDSKGMEYRVMHLYDVNVIWGKTPDGKTDYDLVSGEQLNNLFGKTTIYRSAGDAKECAYKLYYRLEMSDPYLIKDGINSVHLCEPFNFYLVSSKINVPGCKKSSSKNKKVKTTKKKKSDKRTKTNGKDKKKKSL